MDQIVFWLFAAILLVCGWLAYDYMTKKKAKEEAKGIKKQGAGWTFRIILFITAIIGFFSGGLGGLIGSLAAVYICKFCWDAVGEFARTRGKPKKK